MRGLRRWAWIALAASMLAGCAAGYTDKTSPCVCDWTPVGADAAALT